MTRLAQDWLNTHIEESTPRHPFEIHNIGKVLAASGLEGAVMGDHDSSGELAERLEISVDALRGSKEQLEGVLSTTCRTLPFSCRAQPSCRSTIDTNSRVWRTNDSIANT
eukprot:SAG11_NODE_7413_length_1148_cov_0.930410_2_plen_110_part_00